MVRNENDCMAPFVRFIAYAMAAGGILKICSITITTTFAYDVEINKNYEEIDIENLGTSVQYVSVLLTYCTMYFAFIVLCTYLKIWNLFTNLSLIISMIFWTSTINLMFTKALIDNLKLRCSECDGDKLENHHLYMIINISTGILCFSVVSLLLISQIQFRRYKRKQSDCCCDCFGVVIIFLWYIFWPMMMWVILISLFSPEAADVIENTGGEFTGEPLKDSHKFTTMV